jgi:hypothetical protein
MSVPGYPAGGGDRRSGPYVPGGWGPGQSEQDTGPIPRVGGPAAPDRVGFDPARLLGFAVAVLGALNFVFGFLPELTAARSNESLSVFAVGPAYVPVLLLIAGLLALAAFLPGSERSRLAVAAVSVGGAAGAIVSLGTAGSVELVTTSQVGKGMGAILLVIFGIIQAVVAIGAYVVGADFSLARNSPQGAAGPVPAVPSSGVPSPSGVTSSSGTYLSDGGAGYAWSADPGVRPGWFGGAGGSVPPVAPPGAGSPRWPPADPGAPAPDERATGPQPIVDPAVGAPPFARPTHANPAAVRPADGHSAGGDPADGNSAAARPADGHSAGGDPADGNPAAANPADGSPAAARHAGDDHADDDHADDDHADDDHADDDRVAAGSAAARHAVPVDPPSSPTAAGRGTDALPAAGADSPTG